MIRSSGRSLRVGLALALPVLAVNAAVTWWSIHRIAEYEHGVSHTQEVLAAIVENMSTLKDAELWQRSYVLTGDPASLGLHDAAAAALRAGMDRLESLMADNPTQQAHITTARSHIDLRLALLEKSTRVRRNQGFEAAAAVIKAGSGRREMDALRTIFAMMAAEEKRLLRVRSATSRQASTTALATTLISALASFTLIALIYAIAGRTFASRARAEALLEADRRKDEFLATLAHELRNPLAAIQAALDSIHLGGGALAPTLPVTTIEHQAEHLSRLIEDLLDASRIAQGKLRLRREPMELEKAVELALEISRPLLDARGQHLSVELTPDPLSLNGDRSRLAQVFANLLANAARYSGPESRIWLAAAREGDQAVVRVRDEGQGIAPEMMPRLFSLFVQEERGGGDAQGGLGIGLCLVKRLVEMHGGTVEARSEGPGRGSEFIVRLPLLHDEPSRAEEEQQHEESEVPIARHRRILLVDDNVEFTELYSMMLGKHGHEVQVIHDGAAAVEAASRFRPDVVLSDIHLPGLDGFQVAERLRLQPETSETFLVALSGSTQEDDRRRALDVGFDRYLTKPVRYADVEELLTLDGRPRPAV